MSKTVSVIEAAGFKTTGSTAITKVEKGTVSVVVSALAAAAEEDVSVTITGAAAGDYVSVSPNNSAMETGLSIAAVWVSAANTVKIRLSNLNGSGLTGSTSDWTYYLIKS